MQHGDGELGGEAGQVLDQAAHAVVAERDLALQLAEVGQVDRERVGGVGVELADVVQQRARDRDVAVDAAERGGDGAHALRDRQRVLEQPVAVGLVVALGRRGLAEQRPGLRRRPEHRVQQRAQMPALDRRDQLAQVGLHALDRHARAVQQVLERVLVGLGDAQGVDLHPVAALDAAARPARTGRARDRRAAPPRASPCDRRGPACAARDARTISTWSISCPAVSSRTRTRANPRHGLGRYGDAYARPHRTRNRRRGRSRPLRRRFAARRRLAGRRARRGGLGPRAAPGREHGRRRPHRPRRRRPRRARGRRRAARS